MTTEGKRICKCGCGLEFMPRRFWQKFFNKEHRIAFWRGIQRDRYELNKRLEENEERIEKLERQLNLK